MGSWDERNGRSITDSQVSESVNLHLRIDNTSLVQWQHRGSSRRVEQSTDGAFGKLSELTVGLRIRPWNNLKSTLGLHLGGGHDATGKSVRVGNDLPVERIGAVTEVNVGVVEGGLAVNLDGSSGERMLVGLNNNTRSSPDVFGHGDVGSGKTVSKNVLLSNITSNDSGVGSVQVLTSGLLTKSVKNGGGVCGDGSERDETENVSARGSEGPGTVLLVFSQGSIIVNHSFRDSRCGKYGDDVVMILVVLTNTRQVLDDWNVETIQERLWANSGRL